MKSITSSLVFIFIAFFLSLASAAPSVAIPAAARDVFVPPVTCPNSDSVWKVNTTQRVEWDVSNPPKRITNSKARIILVKDGRLDLDNPLAINLDVLVGHSDVVVPNVEPGNNYQILVFGDSGNTGDVFTIIQ